MSVEYFSNFPLILYKGKVARNILLRAALRDTVKDNLSAYLPLTLEAGERTDMIAADLYNNSAYDWIVKLGANVVDPYYDWLLSDTQIEAHMKKKYGSLEYTQSVIIHYKHITEDIIINIDTYNLFDSIGRSDYTPIYAYDEIIESNFNKSNISAIEPGAVTTIDRELEKKLND